MQSKIYWITRGGWQAFGQNIEYSGIITRRMYRERSKPAFGDRRGQRWDIEW